MDGGTLGANVRVTKWRTSQGDKHGALEFAMAPEVREAEAELVKLLALSGGKEKYGTDARGPAIRKVDEEIADTWKRYTRRIRHKGAKRRITVRANNLL